MKIKQSWKKNHKIFLWDSVILLMDRSSHIWSILTDFAEVSSQTKCFMKIRLAKFLKGQEEYSGESWKSSAQIVTKW